MKMETKPLYSNVKQHTFVADILDRLRSDVGTYIDLTRQMRLQGRGVGFWAGVRLLMPVVETLADIYYPHNDRSKVVLFLRERCCIKTPNLIWLMYRNSLIHGDIPRTLKINGKQVSWKISFEGKITAKDSIINLDVTDLYNRVENFLVEELKKELPILIERQEGTEITNPTNEIRDELDSALSTR